MNTSYSFGAVLSFDPDKVKLTHGFGNKKIITKRTTIKEWANITLARRYLLEKRLSLTLGMADLNILAVEVLNWNGKVLSLPYKEGFNLEFLLRNYHGNDRNLLINGIKDLFNLFRLAGFLWGDFAPRNIIWDQSHNFLWLVDFERDLLMLNQAVSDSMFSKYVRSYPWEEFSCFLAKDEQLFVFGDFIDNIHFLSKLLSVDKISSKRKKYLLNRVFGSKKFYSYQEVCYVESLMVEVATPIVSKGRIFFPMDILDFLNDKGGTNAYVKAVECLEDVSDDENRLKKLTEFSMLI